MGSMEILLLAIGATLAAAISGTAGFGGALLLLPLLIRAVGVTEAVPLLTFAQLIGNLARVGIGWPGIHWRPVCLFLLTALPASIAGAALFGSIPASLAGRIIGAVLLLFVALRWLGFQPKAVSAFWLPGAGALVGFLSGLAGSAGPLGAAIFLSLGLAPAAYVATEAATALAMHAVKLGTYSRLLSFSPGFLPLAMLLSGCMVAGTFAGRHITENLPRRRFEQLVTLLLIAAGVQLLWTS